MLHFITRTLRAHSKARHRRTKDFYLSTKASSCSGVACMHNHLRTSCHVRQIPASCKTLGSPFRFQTAQPHRPETNFITAASRRCSWTVYESTQVTLGTHAYVQELSIGANCARALACKTTTKSLADARKQASPKHSPAAHQPRQRPPMLSLHPG